MIFDKFRFDGKVVIVIGVLIGLGQGMVIVLVEVGVDIVGVDYVLCIEIKQKIELIGRRFLEIQVNLMIIELINMIIEKIIQEFGKFDILVNNVGIIRRCDVIDFIEKDWDDVFVINLKIVFFFCQAAVRQFIK